MSRNSQNTRRTRRSSIAATRGKARRQQVLAFADLEIPVRPLLTQEQEFHSGTRIRVALQRLAVLLPHHPVGYQKFLARLQDVTSGGKAMFSWLPFKEFMEADLAIAARCLSLAGSASRVSSARAMEHYRKGVAILRRYPLDPETLYRWCREVRGSLRSAGDLGKVPRFQRIDRLLGRVLDTIEIERDRLVLPNFRLVLKNVFRYPPTGMQRSDLFQEGIVGLQKAAFRFDASRAIRFSTYATYWIRQSIRKSLIDKSRMIRIPQAIQEEFRKTDSALDPLEAERVRRLMRETILFSWGDSDDSNDRSPLELKDPSTPEMGESLHLRRVPHVVSEALGDLDSRERLVVQRRFGLAGERPQTLEEIGIHLNLSRERIRQIEQDAIARMRRSRDLVEIYEDLGTAVATARR